MLVKLLCVINVDFNVMFQLLSRYSIFVSYLRKSGSIMGEYISYRF
jgi:hypothetical protein